MDLAMDLPTRYDPQTAEAAVYARWMDDACFRAVPDARPPYCITIPPPNVTGALHLGHALNNTIMDTLGRWKRMSGCNVLILPGTDHAGIATQSVVERQIAGEGTNRYELGREAFVERVWNWKNEYGDRIVRQMQRLGCGYDWDRLRFTMDSSYVDAIMTVFEDWYAQGYIYLGERIVNWCPHHRTAISDIEVNRDEEEGNLWHLRYPLANGDGEVVVATTRPETMLGDTGVAVHPDDPRYQALVGSRVVLPLVGRDIPIVADAFVDPAFGTGAVKVTPAHDPNDFECGARAGLPTLVVIGPDGKMTEESGPYAGLDRFEARKQVLADLEAGGWLVKTEAHRKAVGRCDRCNTIVEPLLSKQWFCKMAGTPMVEKAIAAARDGDIRFLPERYRESFLRWMENLRDWPISRGLWWGHRLPLWRLADSDPGQPDSWVCARDHGAASALLGSDAIVQSEDVLDTWFSSALWPFATLGWPRQTDSLRYWYPTSLLSTAQEILYLWVARMVMTGEYFLDERPFDDVYIHATILDEQGRRMSKSKGNGIDPVDLIDLYGADALRFALLREAGQRQDIRIRPIRDGRQEQVEQARNFCNKIWNASRFVLMNLDGHPAPTTIPTAQSRADRWIFSRLGRTIREVDRALAEYAMDDAARAVYTFVWDDLCDWTIEAAKPRLQAGDPVVRDILWTLLEQTLRLMHPILPHLTETIWQSLPGAVQSAGVPYLMQARFPDADVFPVDEAAESEWAWVQEATTTLRTLQSENNVGRGSDAVLTVADGAVAGVLAEESSLIASLARVSLRLGAPEGDGFVAAMSFGDAWLARPRVSEAELAQQRQRLETDLQKVETEQAAVEARLADPRFAERAPEAVVAKTRAQAAELAERAGRLRERLAELSV